MAHINRNDTYETFDWNCISEIEDPLTGLPLECTLFFETYTAVLKTLDGSDMMSYVSMWFERSPLDTSQLRFRDDDARSDWLNEAIDMGCIPSLREVCEGEDACAKQARKSVVPVPTTPPKAKPRQSSSSSPKLMGPSAALKQMSTIQATLQTLSAKIARASDGEEVINLTAKRERALAALNRISNVTM